MKHLFRTTLLLGLVALMALGLLAVGCGKTETVTQTQTVAQTRVATQTAAGAVQTVTTTVGAGKTVTVTPPAATKTVTATVSLPPTTITQTSTSAATTTAPTGDTYKIGAVFSVTGRNAPLGEPEKNVATMLEKKINDAGGINGHKVQIIVYDTEGDETKCVTLTKKLIEQDNVSAIVGPTSSGESIAILDTVTKSQIPLVSCAASYKIVRPVEERYWVFKTPQDDLLTSDEIFTHCKANGITKVATICDTSGFGKSGEEALLLEAPKYGITVVAKESYGIQDTDMTTQLTKIRGTDAQAIICWGTNPGPAVIAKNRKDLNITLPLYNSHGIANKEFITLAGEAANGVIFPAGKLLALNQVPASDPQKAVLQQFANEYETAFGKFPNTFAGHAWDAIQILAMAFRDVGPDRAKIRNYLENNIKNFAGTGGVFNMSPQDHNGLGSGAFLLIQIVNGDWKAI